MPADLYKLALAAARKAYAPYSAFPVGAAILTTDGRIFSGCNVENASYPEGWCAETTAIGRMIMDGGGTISEIAILALESDRCAPCGGCRQRIYEFGTSATKVHLYDRSGAVETYRLGELLPLHFSADAKKKVARSE